MISEPWTSTARKISFEYTPKRSGDSCSSNDTEDFLIKKVIKDLLDINEERNKTKRITNSRLNSVSRFGTIMVVDSIRRQNVLNAASGIMRSV